MVQKHEGLTIHLYTSSYGASPLCAANWAREIKGLPGNSETGHATLAGLVHIVLFRLSRTNSEARSQNNYFVDWHFEPKLTKPVNVNS